MKPRTFAAGIAAIVVVVGFILLLNPVTAATSGGASVACGTALKPDMSKAAHDSNVSDLADAMRQDAGGYSYGNNLDGYAAACADSLSTRRLIGWGLAGVGAVVLAGALLIRPANTTPKPA